MSAASPPRPTPAAPAAGVASAPRSDRDISPPKPLVVAAVATSTYRDDPAGNQDAAAVLRQPEGAGVVVADGVGSLPESAAAARWACDVVRSDWNGPSSAPAGITHADDTVRSRLDGTGACTLLTVAVTEGTAHLAWVGNGAIYQVAAAPWSVRGAPATPPADDLSGLLWVNHVIPHVTFEDGRDRLDAVVGGPSTLKFVSRVAVRLPPGPSLWLAVSDGVASAETAVMAVEDGGERWQLVRRPLHVLLTAAADMLADPEAVLACPAALGARLGSILDGLRADGLLDDDATVGAVLAVGR